MPINYDQLSALGLPIGYVALPGEGRSVEISATVGGVDQRWQGELLRLDASIDSDTRLIYAIAVVHDPYGENKSEQGMPLAVGLYVDAMIQGRSIDNGLRIPRSALRAGDTVYVVNEGLLDIRRVGVTHSTPEFAVIHEGLAPGDLVIVSTIRNPLKGMSVQAGQRLKRSIVTVKNGENGQG